MKKILAFSGSNHSNSINEQLLKYVTETIDAEVTLIKAADYEAPLYSIDREHEGIPAQVSALNKIIDQHDAFIIASPEHNGMITAFMKNTLDWLSRTEKKFLGEDAPVMLLSTSGGGYGGKNQLAGLEHILGYFGGVTKAKYSLPKFGENFADGKIISEEENKNLAEAIQLFKQSL